jgi:hypothetical protein
VAAEGAAATAEEGIVSESERAVYVRGLRALADFVEAHEELPVPSPANLNAFARSKAELAALVRTSGIRWEKDVTGDYFYVRVSFDGGHYYDVNVSRDQVCRKVVTGTRVEPAKPERVIEEFHWVCDEPLLAGEPELVTP